MSERDATTAFASALADEWARAGVTDAVIAPGSRSAPLALALARDDRIRVQVVLDERSAAFRALGIGLASGRPAVLLAPPDLRKPLFDFASRFVPDLFVVSARELTPGTSVEPAGLVQVSHPAQGAAVG